VKRSTSASWKGGRRDDTWRSVIVEGIGRALTDPAEREDAVRALIAHNRRAAGRPLPTDGTDVESPRRRHSGGRILRVEQGRISGREKR
jgi:nitroimidazol reductase NimA-like FMN-containing flavoprotein (pyridoxamine 5'-phosphate oxidase superfamily)